MMQLLRGILTNYLEREYMNKLSSRQSRYQFLCHVVFLPVGGDVCCCVVGVSGIVGGVFCSVQVLPRPVHGGGLDGADNIGFNKSCKMSELGVYSK